MNISIPRPCHEDWEGMRPEDQGRHCAACSELVVDFSDWSNEAILEYIGNRNGARICGRFAASQVQAPGQREVMAAGIARAAMPFLRKVAALIVVCFALAQGNEAIAQQRTAGKVKVTKAAQEPTILGELAIPTPATDTTGSQPVKQDTLQPKPMIMGKIAPYQPPKKAPEKAPEKPVRGKPEIKTACH